MILNIPLTCGVIQHTPLYVPCMLGKEEGVYYFWVAFSACLRTVRVLRLCLNAHFADWKEDMPINYVRKEPKEKDLRNYLKTQNRPPCYIIESFNSFLN